MKPPRRKYELKVKIGADSWGDLTYELKYLLSHILDHGPQCNSVSGGSNTNHIVEISCNEEMTHDKYIKELNAYLEARRK